MPSGGGARGSPMPNPAPPSVVARPRPGTLGGAAPAACRARRAAAALAASAAPAFVAVAAVGDPGAFRPPPPPGAARDPSVAARLRVGAASGEVGGPPGPPLKPPTPACRVSVSPAPRHEAAAVAMRAADAGAWAREATSGPTSSAHTNGRWETRPLSGCSTAWRSPGPHSEYECSTSLRAHWDEEKTTRNVPETTTKRRSHENVYEACPNVERFTRGTRCSRKPACTVPAGSGGQMADGHSVCNHRSGSSGPPQRCAWYQDDVGISSSRAPVSWPAGSNWLLLATEPARLLRGESADGADDSPRLEKLSLR